ncbi:hypothetical protein M9H77_30909 [Catharanthus roseus]|uniref:Uncharacterized protein n=1 Tax=Catharanthus roseus TaxID=4058 RepID=A0ACB9ZZW1_CATRO|nr:hypothetical protein M9H77_30909 [Catharanthus roseus]
MPMPEELTAAATASCPNFRVSEARTGQLLGLKDVPAVTYPLGSTSAIGECWRYAVGKHNLYVGKFWKFYFNLSVKVDQSSLPHFGKNYFLCEDFDSIFFTIHMVEGENWQSVERIHPTTDGRVAPTIVGRFLDRGIVEDCNYHWQ